MKLIARSAQSAAGSGADFMDVAELRAFGTPTREPDPLPPVVDPVPVGPPPAVDRTPPAFTLSGAATQRAGSAVRIGVTCSSETCGASARATIRVPATRGHKAKTYRLATARPVRAAKGAAVVLTIKLPAAARAAIRRALKAHKRVSAVIAVTVSDVAGNSASRKRTVRLRR